MTYSLTKITKEIKRRSKGEHIKRVVASDRWTGKEKHLVMKGAIGRIKASRIIDSMKKTIEQMKKSARAAENESPQSANIK